MDLAGDEMITNFGLIDGHWKRVLSSIIGSLPIDTTNSWYVFTSVPCDAATSNLG